MAATATNEDKGLRRLNRAVIAAGAAVVIAVVGATYAVYRLQAVLEGMQQNSATSSSLYNNPDDAWLKTGGDSGK
jgi:hypothetical protein